MTSTQHVVVLGVVLIIGVMLIVIGCALCIGAALVEFRKETQEWQEFHTDLMTGRTSLTVDSEGNISYADSGGMTRAEFAEALEAYKKKTR